MSYDLAAKIAEYISISNSLRKDDSLELYRRANQLSMELFMMAPNEIYMKLGRGLRGDTAALVGAMLDVRRLFNDAGHNGSLGPEDIIIHAPGIGGKNH